MTNLRLATNKRHDASHFEAHSTLDHKGLQAIKVGEQPLQYIRKWGRHSSLSVKSGLKQHKQTSHTNLHETCTESYKKLFTKLHRHQSCSKGRVWESVVIFTPPGCLDLKTWPICNQISCENKPLGKWERRKIVAASLTRHKTQTCYVYWW